MLAKSQSTANCGNGRFVLDHAMFDFGQLTIYDDFFLVDVQNYYTIRVQ